MILIKNVFMEKSDIVMPFIECKYIEASIKLKISNKYVIFDFDQGDCDGNTYVDHDIFDEVIDTLNMLKNHNIIESFDWCSDMVYYIKIILACDFVDAVSMFRKYCNEVSWTYSFLAHIDSNMVNYIIDHRISNISEEIIDFSKFDKYDDIQKLRLSDNIKICASFNLTMSCSLTNSKYASTDSKICISYYDFLCIQGNNIPPNIVRLLYKMLSEYEYFNNHDCLVHHNNLQNNNFCIVIDKLDVIDSDKFMYYYQELLKTTNGCGRDVRLWISICNDNI
jgi:hypothetical protein